MHPELFRIGPLAVHSYGLMLAISFVVGIFLASKLAEKRGIKGDEIVNLGFVIIVSSVIGARLFYVLFHLDEFRGRWIYTFWPVQEDGTVGLGGLILLGGVIFAFIAGALYIRRKKMRFLPVADSLVPGLAFGIFLTRIGCFLNGCCFGKACDLPWGVVFPEHSPAGAVLPGIHLHPTQLYSSAYGLIIFFILIFLEKREKNDGLLLGTFLVLYGISRFTVDFFRYYESQMFLFAGLDFNQVVSLLMLIAGATLLYFRLKLAKGSAEK
ncbi:MAG: prolipoprotein diacylglyceryl transferase [Calditrichia bacterium]